MVKPRNLSGRSKSGPIGGDGKGARKRPAPGPTAARGSLSGKTAKVAGAADPGRGAPPGAQGGETERRILAAARKEFIAKGLEGARMQAIAAEAGVNKALLHYYHRSKDRLYRTVVRDILASVWGNILGQLQAHGPGDGLESVVRTLVSTYTRTLAANPEFPLFMLREMTSGGAAFREVLAEADLPFGDVPGRVLAALQAGMAAGTVRPVHPLHFFMNLLGMSVATFLTRPALERLGPALGLELRFDDAFFEERIRSIVDMAMRGVRTREAA